MENELCPLKSMVAEIEVSYTPNIKPSARPKVTGQDDAYKLFMETWDKTKIELVEQFKIMLLNNANRVLGICTLTNGNGRGTIIDAKQVFSVALKANATRIILAHNHPSGGLIPSKNDHVITKKIEVVGHFLDLKVIDHLVVTEEGYYSFSLEGVF